MNKNTETTSKGSSLHIEPYSLIRDILVNMWVVVLSALIGAMAVYIWSRGMYIPQYTSSSTLIVNIKNSGSYSYTNLSTSSEIAEIYTEVLVQPIVKTRAAELLGVDSFEGKITSSVLSNTNIFTVSVTSSSPETSYKELCAVLEVYPDIADAIFQDSVVETMRSPNLPSYPSNTIDEKYKSVVIAMCALASLFGIIAISVTRDTVKDEEDFRNKVDTNLFGTVVHQRKWHSLGEYFSRHKTSLLITDPKTSFVFTECYQKMATKLEYMKRVGDSRIFMITSVAENEGKSTSVANLALALASRGNRVLLVDMDYKKPALHNVFELPQPENEDFTAVLTGKCSPADFTFAEYKHHDTSLSLALNSQSHADYVRWIHSPSVSSSLNYLADNRFDFILIDTSPLSVAADVASLADLADKTLLVVRTDRDYTADINDATLVFREAKNSDKFAGCILNDVHREFSFLGQFGADEAGHGGHYYGYGYGKSYGSKYNKNDL